MSKVLLIDYENVQSINLSEMKGMDFKVSIFTGSSQSKIPIELVTSAQVLGNRVEWIRIDGNGSNALDFHIAYYLGALIAKEPRNEYFILSRDKGFDPLLKYITKEKLSCKRIMSISELAPAKKPKNIERDYHAVLTNLKKIEKNRRPKNKSTLRQHIQSMLGKFGTEEKINQILIQLVSSKTILEENGRLTYRI
jgi:hypothetical protein